jgi:Tfp pilus assembly protein PilX
MKNFERNNQDGFVAMIMALIIMIFVSLIALGFAFLARQNQVQNQNRLLSTQAFYAAESGVNDAVKYLTSNPGAADNTTDCSKLVPGKTGDIGSTNSNIKYTCVLYTSAPTSLEYPSINANDSKVIRIQAQSGALASVTISWQAVSSTTQFANNSQHWLPQSSVLAYDSAHGVSDGNDLAQSTGILRTTLIPIYDTIKRSDLQSMAQTLFLYPNRATSAGNPPTQPFLTSKSYSDANQGTFVDGGCNSGNTPRFCHVKITGLNTDLGSGTTSTFFLRLQPIYQAANVSISGALTDGSAAHLTGEQANIDATGKADDVLRRIQVRVPLNQDATRPEFSVESINSICKRLQVAPNYANVSWQNIPNPATGTNVSSMPSGCKID